MLESMLGENWIALAQQRLRLKNRGEWEAKMSASNSYRF
jgi:hypothetical protein